ncbi:glycogen synthase GlgA [Methylobacillus gramineus]|uniref:glycogen synthase GlgA n=1 Tax=Methylobacillus gramineus TaxID=755169 RepID=UPI001CFF5F96|nr:glycogen synthase GlgA [Methylobacillus gramineus]MCB5184432.1 glycogen synthase GlgA [Methylobacillus gramineus]
MRILFVSSEAYPLIKTGGLADVSGSLPAALRDLDVDIRILLPGYPSVLQKLQEKRLLTTLQYLPEVGTAKLILGIMPDTGVEVIAIDCPPLYDRPGGPYSNTQGQEWEDNPLRFGILSKVGAILGCSYSPIQDWIPDVVHCNDWQSGLTPAFLHHSDAAQAKSMMSIHNLAFQGSYPAEWVRRLGLPDVSYQINGLEYYGQMSFLKGGIYYADSITTVSPTYAEEIQTEEFGFGMQGLLESRGHEIHGILNGIEMQEWNPATDPYLAKTYNIDHLADKKIVKKALQVQLGLEATAHKPLLGVVSRLTHQKGLDIFLEIAGKLVAQNCQIAVLGNGEAQMEQGFRSLASRYPRQVSVTIGYKEPLSHQIMAGADMFIMPSRFEPCGLNQMYGLRYGTPPIVTRTGGLADSVHDSNASSMKNNTSTGFVLKSANPQSLLQAVERALMYYHDPRAWRKIQRNGMRRDLSWNTSAQAYLNLYQQLIN